MNKKILIISVCVIICLVSFNQAYTTTNGTITANTNISTPINHTNENIGIYKQQTQNMNSNKKNYVIATHKGPNKSKTGNYVPIYCSITNKGVNTIYNVKAWSQVFMNYNKIFGTLKPGETKKFTYMLYIPKNSDPTDIPDSRPLPNPYYIGGFHVTFKDAKGVVHTTTSNSIKIKWYN